MKSSKCREDCLSTGLCNNLELLYTCIITIVIKLWSYIVTIRIMSFLLV